MLDHTKLAQYWNSYNVEDYDRPKVAFVWTIWLRPREKGAYRLFFTKTEKMPQTLWPIRHLTSFKKWKTYGIIFNACIIYIRFLINVHVISSDSAWLNKQYQTNVIIISQESSTVCKCLCFKVHVCCRYYRLIFIYLLMMQGLERYLVVQAQKHKILTHIKKRSKCNNKETVYS